MFFSCWFYAILRSIPNKAAGVVTILLAFAALIAMPFLSTVHYGSPKFRVLSERMFYFFAADVALLTYIGGTEIADTTIFVGQVCTIILFFYLVIVHPFLPSFENFLYLNSISNKTTEVNRS